MIDYPGISSENIANQLIELIQAKACCFVYIKNLNSAEKISTNIMKFFDKLKSRYDFNNDNENGQTTIENFKIFNIIFTHKDETFEMKANDAIDNYDIQENSQLNNEEHKIKFIKSQITDVLRYY